MLRNTYAIAYNKTQVNMKQTDDIEHNISKKRTMELFEPSWLSGLFAVLAALVITFGIILIFSFNNNIIKQQLIGLQNTQSSQPTLTLPGQSPPGTTTSSLQNTWPLLGFWAVVGLMAYVIIELFFNTLHEFRQFNNELRYVHVKRRSIVKNTIISFLFRVCMAIVWLVFLDIFFRRIIPFSILSSHASASNLPKLSGILDGCMSIVLIVFGVHVNVVFLRLVLRRPRIFSSVDYLDV
jgi:hypothetical protein